MAPPGPTSASESLANVYFITIKYVKNDRIAYEEDFQDILNILLERGLFIENYQYELDSRKLLHLHAVVDNNVCLRYTDYMVKGWHIYFRQLKTLNDKKRVISYMSKSCEPNEFILSTHYFIHNYGFITSS